MNPITWLKFFPLEISLLSRQQSADYQGPDFRKSNLLTFLAFGNRISLRAPRHNGVLYDPPLYVNDKDGADLPFVSTDCYATENWVHRPLLLRSWNYRYAWFRGVKSSMRAYLTIMKRAEGKRFAGTSFFHPRSFEFVMANHLNSREGHNHDRGKPYNLAPVNWNVCNHLPVFSATFEIQGSNPELIYVFPITDQHFIELSFSLSSSDAKLRAEMIAFAHQVINSVTLELGAESQAQWDKVKAECGDMRLTETFAPLKWPISPEEIEKGVQYEPAPRSHNAVYLEQDD